MQLLTSTTTLLLGLMISIIHTVTPSAVTTTFLSFDTQTTDEATFSRAAGSFISPDPNPQVSTINPSSLVGRYIRNELTTWDWFLFSTDAIVDASLYLNDGRAFEMDALTYDAPIGTQIDITIENTGLGPYPLGRHSRYAAQTSVQGVWETLVFTFLDRPDVDVGNGDVNSVLISFAPGLNVGGTFFIDNLVAVSDSISTSTTSTVASTSSSSTTRQTTTTELPPTTTSSTSTAATTTSTSITNPPQNDIILYDEFTSSTWDPTVWQPRLPLSQSQATSGVSLPEANDNNAATLLYPKDIPDDQWGPRYSTQIKSTELNMYGNYEARLRSGQANAGEGLISAFFTYRNDEIDYDGDGMHDNHEIDFELLNADRSALFCSVYTDYQYLNDECLFHRNSARIDIATGEVFATVPGNEGNWDLVQVESLPFSVPRFDHSSSFYTYGFEWSESKVAFWIDLEDGVGRRALFEVLSDGSGGMNDHIPNMPVYTLFNAWHTYVDWWSRADAPPPSVDAVMAIDYVKITEIGSSTTNEPTSQTPTPGPANCDIANWYFVQNNGNTRDCSWIGSRPDKRCNKNGGFGECTVGVKCSKNPLYTLSCDRIRADIACPDECA